MLVLHKRQQAVYQAIERNAWNPRLEQERIAWDAAWKILQQAIWSLLGD